jgi:general stress protein 26
MEKLTEELRAEIWGWLEDVQVVCLATVEGDRPRVRPVTMGHYENAFWILTGSGDAKTRQIRANPNVELCLDAKDDRGHGTIRFAGKATVIEDQGLKSRIALQFPFFHQFWQTPEDPGCALLKIEPETVEYVRPGEMAAGKYELRGV